MNLRRVHVRDVLRAVCRVFGVSHDDLTGPCRARPFVRARNAAVLLILAGQPMPAKAAPGLVEQALASAKARRAADGDPEDEANCRDAIKRHCGSAGLLAAIAREFPARVPL